VTNETITANDERENQIEGLARDLVRTISAAPVGERERLRDMAVHLLRDEIELKAPVDVAETPGGTVNPFAIGIPLVLVGGVLLVMFPPVGLLLLGAAVLMMVWGVAAVFFARREH
jgi:hypothetical protein